MTDVSTENPHVAEEPAPTFDRASLRTWFREDIAWIMRELDGIKMRSGAAAREAFNPISPPEEEK